MFFRFLAVFVLLLSVCTDCNAQRKRKEKTPLAIYFENYQNPNYSSGDKIRIEDLDINNEEKRYAIYLNDAFKSQPFTPTLVQRIYEDVRRTLERPYNTYNIVIYAQDVPIEQLISIDQLSERDSSRVYRNNPYRGNPWINPVNIPYSIDKGLKGRHLCVWASHGKYYNVKNGEWMFQRPYLYCTTEDLFTQSIVVPYLIPMLENAGAIVYTPRERDWQKNEVIVDNDMGDVEGTYVENNLKFEWEGGKAGFCKTHDVYTDRQNPFTEGTYRQIEATNNKRQLSTALWIPEIRESGDYAVYVSYKTLPNSISDACYTVVHQGITTSYKVNQKMGGGTWVYLGTFRFSKGRSSENAIFLTNQSSYRGVVTADAVRLGGGISNIARSDTLMQNSLQSGLARCLEGARYTAQWSGFPYDIYSRSGMDDYSDDIRVRSNVANYLARGSAYLPGDSGLCVPLELSLAVHSDAGYRKDFSYIGTLGIYTTGYYDNLTGAGLSRLTSRDFADIVMTQVTNDLSHIYGRWNRRQLNDKNYGETRDPQVPSMILEMLSHQNWQDMRMAHDPSFKFTMARSVYKGILKYLNNVHQNTDFCVQPLPVNDLSAIVNANNNEVRLSWAPTEDMLEPSAQPTHYIIYTSAGDKGYDNGVLVSASETSVTLSVEPKVLYRFKVCAVNAGGKSLSNQEVCAYLTSPASKNILMVDGFQRIAGPLPFDNDSTRGFRLDIDPGVIDVKSPVYCGNQCVFSKESWDIIGESSNELEGMILAGNTHDYCSLYAGDIISGGLDYNISGCVSSSFAKLNTSGFHLVNLIFGAQKQDGYSLCKYKTFTPELMSAVSSYAAKGGNLLLSGAFVGSDMQTPEERNFTKDVFKYNYEQTLQLDSISSIDGMNTSVQVFHRPNEHHYWVRTADVLRGTEGSFCTMLYKQTDLPSAIAYQGANRRALTFGFPLDCIMDENVRRSIVIASVQFLLNNN
ncbi:MAG: fibronectin type III domain-containing protein [Bacteroidaceae bacterium]|nr:fibronectin type III domain-containing protein [Bacteroidaceae bacterium]